MNILSLADLQTRWNYSRAGIHKLAKAKDFPAPIAIVSNGRIKIYQEADIEMYERGKPWLFDEILKQRRQHLFCSLHFAKEADDETKVKILEGLFRENAKPWSSKT